jgi:hypothetical protein
MAMSFGFKGAALAVGLTLLFGTGCSKENAAFEQAQTADSIEAYEAFLRDFPDTTNAVTVQERLDQLYFDAAQNAKTVESYNKYLTTYPTGRHVAEVRGEYEKVMYRDVTKDGSRTGLEAFLKEFPDGNYAQKAQKRLDEVAYYDKLSVSDVKVAKTTVTGADGMSQEGWEITGSITNTGDRPVDKVTMTVGAKGGKGQETVSAPMAPGAAATFTVKTLESPEGWDQSTVAVDFTGIEFAAAAPPPQ